LQYKALYFIAWDDNIEMDLKKIGWEGVDWIHLAQDRTNSGLP